MSRKLYKRVAPHNQRVTADGGVATNNMSDLLLLQRSNEELKDYLKVAFCPELYGTKFRTSGNINYLSKGYSANSIQQELGVDFNPTGQVINISVGSTTSVLWKNVIKDKKYKLVIDNYSAAIGTNIRFSGPTGWYGIEGKETIFTANSNNTVSFYNIGSSSYTFTPHLYEVLSNDLTQTSSTNQPDLDKIAPAEKLSVKNPNGGSNYLTHPTISFSANDEWSVETTLNWNGNTETTTDVLFGGTNLHGLKLKTSNANLISFVSTNSIGTNTGISSNQLVGKNKILTLVGSNGILKLYIDGNLLYTSHNVLNSSTAEFNLLLMGKDGVGFTSKTRTSSHHIFSKALPTQVIAERASILRSIFPEIPFTRIGEQIWSVRNFEAVTTPQGNVIQEMQANSAVEKVVNGGFDTDTNWNKQTGWTIDTVNKKADVNLSGGAIFQSAGIIGKWYKCTYTILSISSGSMRIFAGSSGIVQNRTVAGTYTEFIQCAGSVSLGVYASSDCVGSIDNISIQELGWSGSQELYDGIYAQTSGTVEQKTYAAVKAAAMWCYYGNSVDNGAVYGKLYNWFAVKLLQMDIDYYNAANPNSPFGWRVPTQADFNTLATALGGTGVAGGKLKMQGTTYWNSPNTGADNVSGFSYIQHNRRNSTGAFQPLYQSIWGVDKTNLECNYNLINANIWTYFSAIEGHALRLIKSA